MPKTDDIRSISMSNFDANKIKMSFDLPSGSKMSYVLKSSDISRYRIKDFGQVNMVADDYWDRSIGNQLDISNRISFKQVCKLCSETS